MYSHEQWMREIWTGTWGVDIFTKCVKKVLSTTWAQAFGHWETREDESRWINRSGSRILPSPSTAMRGSVDESDESHPNPECLQWHQGVKSTGGGWRWCWELGARPASNLLCCCSGWAIWYSLRVWKSWVLGEHGVGSESAAAGLLGIVCAPLPFYHGDAAARAQTSRWVSHRLSISPFPPFTALWVKSEAVRVSWVGGSRAQPVGLREV
jgi:hypothetical protein